MNNEPVAYVDPKELQDDFTSTTVTRKKFFVDDVPLYTHPVKDLEDIDINITWNENSMRDFGKDELNFARAILGKAQDGYVAPQRTWVGLTAKEKHEFRYSHMTTADFIDAIEAKLKDKNTRGQE